MSKIIHQVWFSHHKPVPVKPVEKWRTLAAENGWKYMFWGEKECDDWPMINRRLFDRFISRNDVHGASDIVRMEIASQFGGLYVDCDFVPVSKDIEKHIPVEKNLFMGVTENLYQPPKFEYSDSPLSKLSSSVHICNGFFFSPEGDPVIKEAVEGVEDTMLHQQMQGYKYSTCDSIGCFYLTNVAKRHHILLIPNYKVFCSPEELTHGDKRPFRDNVLCCYVDNHDFDRTSLI